MLNIVCVNKGNYLGIGQEYVLKLFDMIGRNLPDGLEGRFICFTDDPIDGIHCPPLPENLKGWFNKLYLFKQDLFPEGDRVLYFDLDTVITGPLDDIVKYDGDFAILRDFYRPSGYQSSVMSWKAGMHGHIWEEYELGGLPDVLGGDQSWIEQQVPKADLWQELYPQKFVSYKVSCRDMFPKSSRVVVFHGEPRPHEAGGWVDHIWKIGGGSSLELVNVANTSDEILINQIKHAMTLPYPWLNQLPEHDLHAVIVGGAPSLKESVEEIKLRQANGQKVFALNNTYKFLLSEGIIPDFHVMLDARPENAEFVPVDANCYYASQCHPSVFEKSNNVTIWHSMADGINEILGDDTRSTSFVGGGSSVGLKAMSLAYLLGYRQLHIYGMDSSYREEEGHAYAQKLNDNEKVISVTLNGRDFKAAPWMVTQVEEFQSLAPQLVDLGCTLTIHGDGLLQHMAYVGIGESNPTNFEVYDTDCAAELRSKAILANIAHIDNPVGAEIGVFIGDLSKRLLRRSDLILNMVDSWTSHEMEDRYAKSGDYHAKLSNDEQESYYQYTKNIVNFAGSRANILRSASLEAADKFSDGSLDFVFIDADHTYEGVKEDIAAWYPKLKSGGVLSGHDYENKEYPCWGVEKAVKEFCESQALDVRLGHNFTWFVNKGQ